MRRGFSTSGDLLTRTPDGRDFNDIWNEFQATLAVYNEHPAAIANLFTFQTTLTGDTIVQSLHDGGLELQSEFGKPKALRAGTDTISMGFPLFWFDSESRMTRKFLRDAPTAQVEAQHAQQLQAAEDLQWKTTLRAVLTKYPAANRPTNETGAVIYPLWDGEADAKPSEFAGQTFPAGHQHYLTTQSAQVDGQDLADLIRHITEHGYGLALNEKVIILVHPNQGQAVRGFRAGQSGSPYDFIPAQSAPAFLSAENIIGDRPAGSFNGLTVIGSYGNALVVEDYFVPNGYVVAVATAGPNSARNPLAFRQHSNSQLQGFRLVASNERYPLIDSTYEFGFGVAVRHRGAAAVMQVTTATEYTSPVI